MGMKNLIIAAFIAVLFGFMAPANAQTQAQAKPANNDIERVETYFKSLKTAKARFIQTAPDGSQSRGTFYLSRPGKLRFQYDAPLKDFVVADGLFIYFYDGELGEQTNAPISQTLADFLLRKNIQLSGELKVTKIMRSANLLQLNVVQAADPATGSLTLGFKESPKLELKKWRVKDSQGRITEIELFDVQQGVELPSKMFVYKNPNKKGYNR
jgi:outer membrane lipoprotein-sorting protein